MKTYTNQLLPAIGVCAAVAAGSGHAALIASDSFANDAGGADYNNGAIGGQAATVGTTGYTALGAWGTGTSAHQVRDGGLTHTGTTGTELAGEVFSFTGQNSSGRRVDRALDYTPTTGIYFFSALFEKSSEASTTEDMLVGLGADLGHQWNAAGSGSHLIGIRDQALVLLTDGTVHEIVNAATFQAGQTYLGLMEIDFSTTGADSITVSFYNEANVLVVSQTVNGLSLDGDLGHFALGASGLGPNVIADELRYGTELSDVFIIPEPGSLALLGLGGLLVLRCRR